jgi:hypothetical protein
VADRVDAAVDAMQPPSRNPALDRPGSETERDQLASGDNAVLLLGEASEGAVYSPLGPRTGGGGSTFTPLGPRTGGGGSTFTLYVTVNLCHPLRVVRALPPMVRKTCRFAHRFELKAAHGARPRRSRS